MALRKLSLAEMIVPSRSNSITAWLRMIAETFAASLLFVFFRPKENLPMVLTLPVAPHCDMA